MHLGIGHHFQRKTFRGLALAALSASVVATVGSADVRAQQASGPERAAASDSLPVQPENIPDTLDGTTFLSFDYDSSKLDAHDRELLDEFVKLLADNPEKQLWIIGFADPRGKEAYNWLLSYRRAKAAKDYLVSHMRVPEDRLFVLAGGEQGYDTRYWPALRRVELTLVSRERTKRAFQPDR